MIAFVPIEAYAPIVACGPMTAPAAIDAWAPIEHWRPIVATLPLTLAVGSMYDAPGRPELTPRGAAQRPSAEDVCQAVVSAGASGSSGTTRPAVLDDPISPQVPELVVSATMPGSKTFVVLLRLNVKIGWILRFAVHVPPEVDVLVS